VCGTTAPDPSDAAGARLGHAVDAEFEKYGCDDQVRLTERLRTMADQLDGRPDAVKRRAAALLRVPW
jgi:hypothetical protein